MDPYRSNQSKKKPDDIQKRSYENSSIILATYANFDVISVYRFSEHHRLIEFTDNIMKLVNINHTVIILGDVNLDLNKNPTNLFTQTLQNFGFVQLVDHPTHILGGIIDHVYFYSPTDTRLQNKHDAICTTVTIMLSPSS